MLGAVDIAGPQITDQQLLTAKDIQREEAVGIVITMEEAPFLQAVHPVVGGIKVENQLFGWLGKGCDELLHQHMVNGDRRLTAHTVLQTAQGR